jgi:hypothetical protein
LELGIGHQAGYSETINNLMQRNYMQIVYAKKFLPIIFILAAGLLSANIIDIYPDDDWLLVIGGEHLSPGDTVIMHAGTYITPDNEALTIAHVGTAEQPITIKAAKDERVVITRNTFGDYNMYGFGNGFNAPDHLIHNTLNIRGAQYLILDGLEIIGGNWGIRIGAKTDWVYSTTNPMGNVLRYANNIISSV